MKDFLEKITSVANNAGDMLMNSSVAKRVAAGVIAFSVVLTPLTPTFLVMAEEALDTETTVEETVSTPVETTVVTEATVPETSAVPETEEVNDEPVVSEDADIDVTEPTETIDTTAPPTEETGSDTVEETEITNETEKVDETTVTEPSSTEITEPAEPTETTETAPVETEVTKTSEIVKATEDNFADLIAALPSSNRLIVAYKGELDVDAKGVYYDGVYYLSFTSNEALFNAVGEFDVKGIPFALDGNAKVNGDVVSYERGVLNSNAKTKVAVIDTGSNLANEKYSVLGDDLKDYNGHGTAMVNNILEGTNDAYIISIKAMANDGTGNVSDICAAVQMAMDLKVDIIFMALSFKDTGDFDAFKDLAKEAQKQKITFIVSAGNNSADASKYLPASLEGAITVGAIVEGEYKAPLSNYGSLVNYYIEANTTSEASSIFAGKYIAGNIEDVATSCILRGRPTELDDDYLAHINAERTLKRAPGISKGAFIYITADQMRAMGYKCSDDFRSDIIAAAKYLSGVQYQNNNNDDYQDGSYRYQHFLCLDYVHSVYGMIVIPDGKYNPGVGGSGSFTRHGKQTTTSAPQVTGGRMKWYAYFSFENGGTGSKRIGSPYYLYPYFSGTGCSYWTNSVVTYSGSYADSYVSCTNATAQKSLGLKAGDIVFFGPASDGTGYGHAAIYSGTNGYFYDCRQTGEASGYHHRSDGEIVTNGPGTYTRMMAYKIEEYNDATTILSLTKSSSIPEATEGNACYDLAGTTYELYSDAECTDLLETFVVNSEGKTETVFESSRGATYYLKETVVGKGYIEDELVYTVKVSANGVVTVSDDVSVTETNGVYYMNMEDEPGQDPLTISLRKVDKNGNIVHKATLSGAVFRFSYYAQDLGVSGNNDAEPTVVYDVLVSGNSKVIALADLRGLTPVGGSNPTYLSNLPDNWFEYPYGTIRIQEVTAPAGYKVNDQVVRYRLLEDGIIDSYLESNSAYGDRDYWLHQQDGSWDLTELPTVGYYALTKSLDDTDVRSTVEGFIYELYNTSSSDTPTQVATGVTQSDGRVLWTYTVPNYYKNTDDTVLLTGTTTYELELPATEKDGSGEEVAIQYEVREIISSVKITYGNTSIPYTFSTPDGWEDAEGYFYKAITVSSDDSVFDDTIVNNYEYTGINVNKVVPAGNTFDRTKVTFKLYNLDKNILIANGSVDSNGNVTWNRVHTSGYGIAPASSINVINFLPLGNYKVEETWDKDYLDVNDSVSILIEEKNNNEGWTKTETTSSYTYSYELDLTAKANDEDTTALAVENERLTKKFNLTKTVTVEGDSSIVSFKLYRLNGSSEILVANGSCNTEGPGSYGVTWVYQGSHEVVNGLDTLELPVGTYRIVEDMPVTFYPGTTIPYTYLVPEGYTERVTNGKVSFFKDFTLTTGDYETVTSETVTNVRISGSFEIFKVERSGENDTKSFIFEVYYRGNGDSASTSSALLDTVTVNTTNGKGSVSLENIPEGWYEIKEVDADNSWLAHWANPDTVVNGNKVVRLSSENRTVNDLKVDDGIEVNGTKVNGVLIYNDVKPEIKTTLVDRATNDHITSLDTEAKLDDTVSYKNVMPGHYVMSGTLMDKSTGKAVLDKNGDKVTGSTSFDVATVLDEYGQPIPQTGEVVVTFTIDTTALEGSTFVAFEDLREGSITGSILAEHEDIDDVDQTVVVPKIRTTASDAENGTKTLTYNERVTIKDKVSYENLIPGKTYTATGVLMDALTGEVYTSVDGNTYEASTDFVADNSEGFVEVVFEDVLVSFESCVIVVFEDVFDTVTGTKVATHSDLSDKDQTVRRATASTTATVGGKKDVWLGSTEVTTITITDKISFTGLEVGTTYRAEATLYKSDGTVITNGNQMPVTSVVEFVPSEADGFVNVDITFSTEGLVEGDKVVVFEKVFDVATEAEISSGTQTEDVLIATHEDLEDKDQTVTIHFRVMTGFVDTPYAKYGIAFIVAALGGTLQYFRVKKKNEAEAS